MHRRQLFLSTARAAIATAFSSPLLSGKASAQSQSGSRVAPVTSTGGTIHGVAGSPSATITIDGRHLPPTPPTFGGVIKESAKNSRPWWAPRVVPPQGAPNVLLIMTDDQGYGVSGTFGGVIPTPALPMRDKLRVVRTLALAQSQAHQSIKPYQQLRYWSTVPFRHGPDEVVKQSATPSPGNPANPLQRRNPDALRNELVRHLEDGTLKMARRAVSTLGSSSSIFGA